MDEDEFYSKFSKLPMSAKKDYQLRCIAQAVHEFNPRHRRIMEELLAYVDANAEDVQRICDGRRTKEEIRQQIKGEHPQNTQVKSDPLWDIASVQYNIAFYVWGKLSSNSSSYVLEQQPCAQVVSPKRVVHVLHAMGNFYTTLLPNKDYVATSSRSFLGAFAGNSDTERDESVSDDPHAAEQSLCPTQDRNSQETTLEDPELVRRSSLGTSSTGFTDFTVSSLSMGSVQSLGSSTSRPDSASYAQRFTVDIVKSVVNMLGGYNMWCCVEQANPISGNCLRAFQSDSFEQLQSKVLPTGTSALEVINNTRRQMQTMSESQRTSFLVDQLHSGYETNESGDVRWNFRLCWKGGEDGKTLLRRPICEKAFTVFYHFNDRLIRRHKKLILDNQGGEGRNRLKKSLLNRAVRPIQSSVDELNEDAIDLVRYVKSRLDLDGQIIPNSTTGQVALHYGIAGLYDQYRKMMLAKIADFDANDPNRMVRRPHRYHRTRFYQIIRRHIPNIIVCRFSRDFLNCDTCLEIKAKFYNPTATEEEKLEAQEEEARHRATTREMKIQFSIRTDAAAAMPNDRMSISIDGMDQKSSHVPNFKHYGHAEKNKAEAYMKHKLMGVRVHDVIKRDYLYLTPPFVAEEQGSNLTIECLIRTFLKEETYRREKHMKWPHTLYVQMDNTSKENKNKYLFAFWTYLIEMGVFEVIYVNFFMVGHTHTDIDQVFSVVAGKLDHVDTYTFDHWLREVQTCYIEPQQRIRDIDYLWALHDYRSWLNPHIQEGAYQGYRSTVFHLKFYALEGQRLPVMSYAVYDYHVYMDQGGYFPKSPDIPESWLKSVPDPAGPQLDKSHGTWPALIGTKTNPPTRGNKHTFMAELTELFQLPTNNASEVDIRWWWSWLENVPEPGGHIDPQLYIPYQLPNVEELNKSAVFRSFRENQQRLDGVGPVAPSLVPVIRMTNLSATDVRHARQIIEDDTAMERDAALGNFAARKLADVDVHDKVVFKLAADFWEGIGLQRGLPDAARTLPWTLGAIVSKNEIANTINVKMHYSKRGLAKGPWIPWIHEGHGQHPWTLDIPIESVTYVNPQFNADKQTFSETTLKKLGDIKHFNFGFSRGYGLLPWEQLASIIQDDYENPTLVHSSDPKDIATRKKYLAKLKSVLRLWLLLGTDEQKERARAWSTRYHVINYVRAYEA